MRNLKELPVGPINRSLLPFLPLPRFGLAQEWAALDYTKKNIEAISKEERNSLFSFDKYHQIVLLIAAGQHANATSSLRLFIPAESSQPIGEILINRLPAWAEIDRMTILHNFRGIGLGTRLLHEALLHLIMVYQVPIEVRAQVLDERAKSFFRLNNFVVRKGTARIKLSDAKAPNTLLDKYS